MPGVLAVNFEAGDDSGEGSELLPRTLVRSQERAASCCVRCEAVLVEPKSGEYVPPSSSDAAAPAATATATAAAGAGADADAVAADAPVDAPAEATGNGHSDN
jgi:hypothetical protein